MIMNDDPYSTNNSHNVSRAAIHEAGHVVMAFRLGRAVSSVTIDPDDKHAGFVDTPDIAKWPIQTIVSFKLAGGVAEKITFGIDKFSIQSSYSDENEVMRIFLETKHRCTDYPKYHLAHTLRCIEILENELAFRLLHQLAKTLDERKTLTFDDIQKIIQSFPLAPPPAANLPNSG